MDKQFTFSIKTNGLMQRCSFTAPVQTMAGNSFVVTNRFRPDELSARENTIFGQIKMIITELEDEFIHDCQNIVNISNTISDDDTLYCLGRGLKAVISEHIRRHGRLLFNDLLLYMDCFAYLGKSIGYADSEIRRLYPALTKRLVDVCSQYVKDPHTLTPFQTTDTYRMLCKLAAQQRLPFF